MFLVSSSKTMANAKRIVPDEPIKLRPENRIADRKALQPSFVPPSAPIIPAPPVQEEKKFIPKSEAQEIINEVCIRHGVTYAAVMSKARNRHVVAARTEAIWALKEWRPSLSLPRIGRLMGGRDHTTILHALRKRGS